MSYEKSDFVGTFVLNTAEEVEFVLAAANNRGNACFTYLAPYGTVTTEGPLSYEEMRQGYVLDEAAVEDVLGKCGIRGGEFLLALSTFPGVIDPPAADAIITVVAPNVYEFAGAFTVGKTVSVGLLLTDPDNQTSDDSFSWNVVSPMTPQAACLATANAIDALTHYRGVANGTELTITPAAPANQISSDISVA